MNTLTLQITELSPTPKAVRAPLPSKWCDERLVGAFTRISDNFDVSGSARKTAEVIEVELSVRGKLGFACSRCAEASELLVETSFSHHFVGPGQLDAGDPAEFDSFDADPDVSEHNGTQIDLKELCIEQVIVALPDAPVCDEDCRGLCPSCGCNKNVEQCECTIEPVRASPWQALAGVKIQR